jgi:hypothetical protein
MQFSSLYDAGEGATETQTSSPPRLGRARIAMAIAEVVLNQSSVFEEQESLGLIEPPIGLAECPRCSYLEKLTVTQQNDS